MEAERSASSELVGRFYRRYNAALLGFDDYWYAVMLSRDLGRKPRSVQLAGRRIMLVRDRGRVFALRDRCPHRGVPLSEGRCEYPGTITCAYHAWTYDLQTGNLIAVLTDSPDSPIVNKQSVRVQTYPVEERAGLIWIYPGDGHPPPVETDVPNELLRDDAVIEGVVRRQPGNWRLAAEAGIDEGHARYLHRRTLFFLFREFPAWTKSATKEVEDGAWMARDIQEKIWSDVHPAVGRWPTKPAHRWQRKDAGGREIAIRLPGIVRIVLKDWNWYEFYVPADEDHYTSILLAAKWPKRALGRLAFRARYWTTIRPLAFGQFNGQDTWMVENMDIPPERLYRPDASITGWRKLCEDTARGEPIAPVSTLSPIRAPEMSSPMDAQPDQGLSVGERGGVRTAEMELLPKVER